MHYQKTSPNARVLVQQYQLTLLVRLVEQSVYTTWEEQLANFNALINKVTVELRDEQNDEMMQLVKVITESENGQKEL